MRECSVAIGTDHAGMVWSLNGRKLIAPADAAAVMEVAPGVRQTYRRLSTRPGNVVLPWHLDRERPTHENYGGT
jgi:hypothetical protein